MQVSPSRGRLAAFREMVPSHVAAMRGQLVRLVDTRAEGLGDVTSEPVALHVIRCEPRLSQDSIVHFHQYRDLCRANDSPPLLSAI